MGNTIILLEIDKLKDENKKMQAQISDLAKHVKELQDCARETGDVLMVLVRERRPTTAAGEQQVREYKSA